MKSISIFAAATLLSASPLFADQNNAALKSEAKSIIQSFAGNLKGELQAAMKAGGPPNAIQVCNTRAPVITGASSDESGWSVGRTSLKLRNADNKPDAWELGVLKAFEERKAAGEDPMKIAYAEVVEENGGKTFRFMKAIPTGDVCLACHGASIKPEIAAKLDSLYPQDMARGFSVGDLRGAFTLSKGL